jgi:hypothetical protein
MDDGRDGSPSCWRRRTTVTTATIPPPVLGRDGQRRQWVPQLLVGMDGGDPKYVLAGTSTVMVTTLAQLSVELDDGGNGSPVVGNGSPSCWCSHLLKWTKAVKAPPVVGEGSNSCQQSWTKAAMATIPPPVIGGDGRWRRRVPQLLAETDNGGNGFPSCQRRQMVTTQNVY